jgi:DNA polymerase-3 subunit gamma/tau
MVTAKATRTTRTVKAATKAAKASKSPQQPDYVPLHQKYRPQRLGEIVGQEVMVGALSQAITTGRIAPAYLFTGIRGTGKTSTARVLAKSLNCTAEPLPTLTPCGVCESCHTIAAGHSLDVTEIDAASHTGVENVRKIIEDVHLAAIGRYRLWIIDEVHKLSNAAMNALLKVLEEPPQNVVFVLATTEIEKVLDTIRSRCQQYLFMPVEMARLQNHLGWIAEQEGIVAEDDALARIAQLSGGSVRDATRWLDQASLLPQPLTVDAVDQLTGTVSEEAVLHLMMSCLEPSDGEEELLSLNHQLQVLLSRGHKPIDILTGMAQILQLLMLAQYTNTLPEGMQVMTQTWDALLQLPNTWVELSRLRQMNRLLREAEPQIRNAALPELWLRSVLIELDGL